MFLGRVERNNFGNQTERQRPLQRHIRAIRANCAICGSSCPGGHPHLQRHNRPPAEVTGDRLQVTAGKSGVNTTDQRSMITDQKRRTSNDLFIDHYSLVIERSACANEIIFCGYPDNNRVVTDIGTGLNDPESELYYVRNRTYSPVLSRWIQRDSIGYAGGVNFYEYVGGRAVAEVNPSGMLTEADCEAQANRCVDDCWNRRTDWPYRRDKGWYNKCQEDRNEGNLYCLKRLNPPECQIPGPAIDIATGAGAAAAGAEGITIGDVGVDVIIGILVL